ncbi:hypothetical protein JG688_00013755 [Phytophthora aleatoria]|uniref:Uncharacterized protein n=1 Tax=Phytophthora aleatoria TaxID=2496075 RepID=A0A8J5I8J4_9STRA|nr:hypothetical protein JG688_00013755 [Phytophthora aleatoria]
MMVPHFDGEPCDARTQSVLKRRKLDLSTLNVVHLSLKMLLAPEPQKRPKGDVVDEKKSGSKLLNYADMLQEKIDKIEETRATEAAKQAAKLARKAAKLSRSKEVEAREEMAQHDKPKPKKSRKRSCSNGH